MLVQIIVDEYREAKSAGLDNNAAFKCSLETLKEFDDLLLELIDRCDMQYPHFESGPGADLLTKVCDFLKIPLKP